MDSESSSHDGHLNYEEKILFQLYFNFSRRIMIIVSLVARSHPE